MTSAAPGAMLPAVRPATRRRPTGELCRLLSRRAAGTHDSGDASRASDGRHGQLSIRPAQFSEVRRTRAGASIDWARWHCGGIWRRRHGSGPSVAFVRRDGARRSTRRLMGRHRPPTRLASRRCCHRRRPDHPMRSACRLSDSQTQRFIPKLSDTRFRLRTAMLCVLACQRW